METKFLLVHSLRESLVLNVMDFNDHRHDTVLGSASFALEVLEHDATQEDILRPILKDGNDRGELRFDVSFYPIISLSKTSQGTVQKLPETSMSQYTTCLISLTIFRRRRHSPAGPSSGKRPRHHPLYVRRSKPIRQGLLRQPLYTDPYL